MPQRQTLDKLEIATKNKKETLKESMGIIATAVEYMIAAGITGEVLVSAVADMEAGHGTPIPGILY